jgi:hypothetical protein
MSAVRGSLANRSIPGIARLVCHLQALQLSLSGQQGNDLHATRTAVLENISYTGVLATPGRFKARIAIPRAALFVQIGKYLQVTAGCGGGGGATVPGAPSGVQIFDAVEVVVVHRGCTNGGVPRHTNGMHKRQTIYATTHRSSDATLFR